MTVKRLSEFDLRIHGRPLWSQNSRVIVFRIVHPIELHGQHGQSGLSSVPPVVWLGLSIILCLLFLPYTSIPVINRGMVARALFCSSLNVIHGVSSIPLINLTIAYYSSYY